MIRKCVTVVAFCLTFTHHTWLRTSWLVFKYWNIISLRYAHFALVWAAWYPIPSNRIDGYVTLPRHACMHVLNAVCIDNRVMQFMRTRHLMLLHDVVLYYTLSHRNKHQWLTWFALLPGTVTIVVKVHYHSYKCLVPHLYILFSASHGYLKKDGITCGRIYMF